MNILAISDIHGRINYEAKVLDTLTHADLVVICGDITNFGGNKEAIEVLNAIRGFNSNILAIPGNCDRLEVLDVLRLEKISLHGEMKEYRGVIFFGIGGSGHTPFNTPQEYSDYEIKEILKKYKRKDGIQVFVSHTPPINTRVDKTLMGLHAGSKLIREFIEMYQPDLCLCGHIHEARNSDHIGKTIIVNPGPFPKNFARISITDKIDVELLTA
jgi:putative phosphoesterase